MAKFFLVLTLIAAGAAAGLGWVTYQKIGEQRTDLKTTKTTLSKTQSELVATKDTLKTTLADLSTRTTERDTALETVKTRDATIEQLNKDKTDLQGQVATATGQVTTLTGSLDAANKTIDDLRKLLGQKPGDRPINDNDVVTKLKHDLDEATQVNKILTDKVTKLQTEIDTHKAGIMKTGIVGMVMAVNPGYGFVVVSLGDRQGSVANAEMIVSRDGREIAKLKVTTVEAALSVADIIPDTLGKGQRILPGDKVIFSGSLAP